MRAPQYVGGVPKWRHCLDIPHCVHRRPWWLTGLSSPQTNFLGLVSLAGTQYFPKMQFEIPILLPAEREPIIGDECAQRSFNTHSQVSFDAAIASLRGRFDAASSARSSKCPQRPRVVRDLSRPIALKQDILAVHLTVKSARHNTKSFSFK